MTTDVADEADLIDALVRAAFMTTAILSRIGQANDLSLTQLRLLGILRDRRARMSELAAHLGLDKSTMTGLVDRAAGRGLLRRAPNATDGRAVDVLLSDEGHELAERLYAEVSRSLAPVTGLLSTAERHRLTTLLELVLSGRA